jgi:hypothetical protein
VIQRTYPNDFLQIGRGEWIVADEPSVTPHLVTAKLGLIVPAPVNVAPVSTAIVISAFGAYGLMPASVWSWINQKVNA